LTLDYFAVFVLTSERLPKMSFFTRWVGLFIIKFTLQRNKLEKYQEKAEIALPTSQNAAVKTVPWPRGQCGEDEEEDWNRDEGDDKASAELLVDLDTTQFFTEDTSDDESVHLESPQIYAEDPLDDNCGQLEKEDSQMMEK
jgi:hypothetical protein